MQRVIRSPYLLERLSWTGGLLARSSMSAVGSTRGGLGWEVRGSAPLLPPMDGPPHRTRGVLAEDTVAVLTEIQAGMSQVQKDAAGAAGQDPKPGPKPHRCNDRVEDVLQVKTACGNCWPVEVFCSLDLMSAPFAVSAHTKHHGEGGASLEDVHGLHAQRSWVRAALGLLSSHPVKKGWQGTC